MKAARTFILILLLCLSLSARAETAAEIAAYMQQLNEYNATNVPPEPPKNSDRPKQAGGANAAAIAGAAIAGVSCIMMMNEARKTGDKMMMMMALQQCAQAAAMAANAGQNKQAQQAAQSTSTYTPKQAPAFPMPKTEEPEIAVQQPPAKQAESEDWDFDLKEEPKEVRKAEAVAPDQPVAKAAIDNPFSTLDPIPGQTSTYTDKKLGDGGVAPAAASGVGQMTLAQAKELSPAELKAIVGNHLNSGRGRGVASEDAGGGSSGGGDSSASSGGGSETSALDGMLAQLMGGGAAGAGGGGYGMSEVVILPEGGKAGGNGKRRNIFEFANDEYKYLAHQKGRIRTKIPKQATSKVTELSTASADNP